MKETEKMNEIGKLVVDLKLELFHTKRMVQEMRRWMLEPDTLEIARRVHNVIDRGVKDYSEDIKKCFEEKGLTNEESK